MAGFFEKTHVASQTDLNPGLHYPRSVDEWNMPTPLEARVSSSAPVRATATIMTLTAVRQRGAGRGEREGNRCTLVVEREGEPTGLKIRAAVAQLPQHGEATLVAETHDRPQRRQARLWRHLEAAATCRPCAGLRSPAHTRPDPDDRLICSSFFGN
jgi:hypothetical protein